MVLTFPLFLDIFHGVILYLNSSKSEAGMQNCIKQIRTGDPGKPQGLEPRTHEGWVPGTACV